MSTIIAAEFGMIAAVSLKLGALCVCVCVREREREREREEKEEIQRDREKTGISNGMICHIRPADLDAHGWFSENEGKCFGCRVVKYNTCLCTYLVIPMHVQVICTCVNFSMCRCGYFVLSILFIFFKRKINLNTVK